MAKWNEYKALEQYVVLIISKLMVRNNYKNN